MDKQRSDLLAYARVKHVSELNVGDVVRPLIGPLLQIPGAPAINDVAATRGWRPYPPNHENNQNIAYMTMTVYVVSKEYVSFVRPFISIEGLGYEIKAERVDNFSRDHGGYWYELLSKGRG